MTIEDSGHSLILTIICKCLDNLVLCVLFSVSFSGYPKHKACLGLRTLRKLCEEYILIVGAPHDSDWNPGSNNHELTSL